MPTKKEIEEQAKALLDSNPAKAVVLYRQIWDEFHEEFNAWDALFLIKALRKVDLPDVDFGYETSSEFVHDEKVSGIFGWLIFDQFVKQKSDQFVIENEHKISKFLAIISQENQTVDGAYLCPKTITILKMAGAFSSDPYNAQKVCEWTEQLNPDFLSKKPKEMTIEKKGKVELASDTEKYFSLRTKCLLKMGRHAECKSTCNTALKSISKFHYDNDLWFKMRIAISDAKLGNITESEGEFSELLTSPAGHDKWFLYQALAELYCGQNDFHKAWKYAVDAGFYGSEPHMMIRLFRLQRYLLEKLDRSDDAKSIALIMAAIYQEQGWGLKPALIKIFDHYEIKTAQLAPLKTYYYKSKEFWASERFKDLNPEKGTISDVHPNGKKGRIRSEDGNLYSFHKKNLRKKTSDLKNLKSKPVEFYGIQTSDGKALAEYITVSTPLINTKKNSALKGQELEGTIKNIQHYGCFVKFEGHPDGLLHKGSLSKETQASFPNGFNEGEKIKVRVIEVTDKGLSLTLEK